MFLSVISFVSGIIVVQQFHQLPGVFWVLCLLGALACSLYFRYWRLMFFVIGLLWAICFASIRLADRLSEVHQGQLVQITGKVVGLPRKNLRNIKFDFEVIKPKHNFPSKIKLSWYYPKQLVKTGQTWRLTVKLKQPHGRFNPHQFDYERWLFVQNIGATAYIKNKPEPKLLSRQPVGFNIDLLRQLISDKLTKILGNNEYIGVIKALTIGERSEITDEQWLLFRNTGTVHLLAISGLHIGLLAGFSFFVARIIAIRASFISPQIVAVICSLLTAIFYSALAGFSLPTQRALLMLTVAMTAILLQRNISSINALLITMLLVLVFDPLAVLSAGFWLSYLAVVLIIYSVTGRLAKSHYFIGALKIHWVTAFGMSPLLIYYFQQVSIIAPFANFITVPLISLIVVPLCLLSVLFLFINPLIADLLLSLTSRILQGLGYVLSFFDGFTYATFNASSVSFYAVLLSLFGVAILLSPRGVPARWLGLLMFLPLMFSKIDKPVQGEVTMTLLDVGQGLATVVETTNYVLVFDTGARYSQYSDMGKTVVLPFLKHKGIKQINTLIISHGDNDHSGGAKAIIAGQKINTILTSAPKLFMNVIATQCIAGQAWVWDNVEFKILSPQKPFYLGENDNSCVLKITTKAGSILLTGDIEKTAEQGLVNHFPQHLKSDVLIAPHHGSKTSSTSAFLKEVNPDVIIIPAGYQNKFSFPHQQVLDRYKEINSTVYNLAEEGAVIVKLKNKSYTVQSMRKVEGKYWN